MPVKVRKSGWFLPMKKVASQKETENVVNEVSQAAAKKFEADVAMA